jgi:hypothetical protein
MKEKINQAIEKVETSSKIPEEKKSAVIEKLREWQEEEPAIEDIAGHFEQFWIELEPIFAELGWI